MNSHPTDRGHELHDGTGILLVGHGTRDVAGQREFLQTAEMLRRALLTPVEACFLEIARPTIEQGWRALSGLRVKRIVVAPVLLFAAGHARHDIPQVITDLATSTPGIPWKQSDPLDCHEAILKLSARRFNEVAAGFSSDELAETALIMVGRGSLDAGATAAMHRFAAFRNASSKPSETRVGFIALAQQRIADVLQQTFPPTIRRVIVQPHLLFAGLLLDEVRSLVEDAMRKRPNIDWRMTDRLGPDPLVIDALADRIVQAMEKPAANEPVELGVLEKRV
jgi:sirohydrochlorin cobaltochelatase